MRGGKVQAAIAAGSAASDAEADTAPTSASAELRDGEHTGTIELLEVDPAELDRPEGAVGADAPDPEDADLPAVRQMRSDQQAKAEAVADESATDTGQPVPWTSALQPDGPKGEAEAGGGKQRGRPARKRRGAAAAVAGQRLTRARAGAAVAPNAPPDVGAQPQAGVLPAGAQRRSSTAAADSSATEVAAGPKESAPAAPSNCVLLDEARELSPGQHVNTTSVAPKRADMLPDLTSRSSLQHGPVESERAGACSERGAAAAGRSPAASDSEQSSAMAVTPHLRAEQNVDSSSMANPAAAHRRSEGKEAVERDPAAVRQV